MGVNGIDSKDTELLRVLREGGEIPFFRLFRELAEEWHKRNPGARNLDLAALLDTRPQAVSQWKSGSDPRRRPPWSAMVLLSYLCKKQIVITPAGARLARLRRDRKNESETQDKEEINTPR